MIVTANLLIKKIENGTIVGMDITNKKLYTGKFFTDLDLNKMPNKEKPNDFKSTEISHEMLLEMLENSNNFNEREKKVSDKIKEELDNSSILKTIQKYISRMEDDKEDILSEETTLKIKEEELQNSFGCKTINNENYDAIYSKMKTEYDKAIEKIKQNVNDGYDISINSPIIFTGNLTKDEVILSKNAYIDLSNKLTGRTSFYSAGIRGDYYKDNLLMAVRIDQKLVNEKKWFEYIIDGEFLTQGKLTSLIKRTLSTIHKTNQDLFISFVAKNKEFEVVEIKELEEVISKFNTEAKGSQKRKEIFETYKEEIVSKFEDIKLKIEESNVYSQNIIDNYDVKLPIKNNYELEINIKEIINAEIKAFKNINKKMIDELVELRTKNNSNNDSTETIKNNLENYIYKLYETEINKISKYGTYFRIAGVKDVNNDGYGFITEVAGSSKKVKNFIGFSVCIEELEKGKQTIFDTLNGMKEKIKVKK